MKCLLVCEAGVLCQAYCNSLDWVIEAAHQSSQCHHGREEHWRTFCRAREGVYSFPNIIIIRQAKQSMTPTGSAP